MKGILFWKILFLWCKKIYQINILINLIHIFINLIHIFEIFIFKKTLIIKKIPPIKLLMSKIKEKKKHVLITGSSGGSKFINKKSRNKNCRVIFKNE
jgi:hypothetical protein